MPTVQQDLRELRKLKADRDKKKEAFSAAEDKFKRKQYEVYARMEAEGIGSTTDTRLGIQFVPAETVYATIQDRSEFVDWAKANDVELVKEDAREDLLNQLVRERLDNGEPLPPGVGFRVRQYISQRAA